MAGIGEIDSRGISAAPPIGAFAAKLLDYGKEIDARSRQEKSDAEAQRRWDITNNRAEEVYQRQLLDQKATDAANAELSKGPQVYGGALNTQVARDQANANSFTPEEIKKYDMYKDSKTARAAGENALADKMDWQTNLSNVADTLPGSGAANESRVQMYEGVMARLAKQGLPVPPSIIASADQARLFEAQETAATLKDNSEAQAKNSADQIANAKYMVANAFGGNSGQQSVTDENGTVVGYAPSAAINRNNKSTNSYMDDVAKGSTGIIKAVTGLGVKDGTPTAVDAVNLYKEILANDPTIDPGALQATIEANVGKDPATFFGLFGGDSAALKQDNIQKLTASIKNTRVPTADITTASSGGSTKSEEAAKLSSQISSQQAGTAQQLRDERAKILRGADGRREDRVNEILMNAGLVKRPEVDQESVLKFGKEDYNGVYNTGQGYSDTNTLKGKIASNETGGIKDPYSKTHPSGALGKYGFVPSTAIEQMKALKYSGTDKELLSKFLSTPSIQDTVMDRYMGVNSSILSKSNVPVTDWTVWTAHNLGAGNAIKLAKGNIDDGVLSAISKNLPKGVKPTVANYQAHWFDKMNIGDENKKYVAPVTTKADEILKKVGEEEGKTAGVSKVTDLFNKVNTEAKVDKDKSLNARIESDVILNRLQDEANKVSPVSAEFQKLKEEFNTRRTEVVKDARGMQLRNYMNRQTSSPEMEKVNEALMNALQESPEVLRAIGIKGDESIFDMQKMLIDDGNKLKRLITSLLNNKTKGLEGRNIIPSIPLGYIQ